MSKRGPLDRTGVAGAGVAPAGQAGRYRWYVLFVLTLAQACHALDRAIFGLVMEPLRTEFRLSDQQLGLLAGFAYGMAFAVMAIPFGMAADRFNRRNLLTAALTVWSGVTALCGLAGSYAALMVSRATVGAAESGGSPTGVSILTDYFDADERATAVSIWYISSGIGTALAFLGGGYIVEHYGWRAACIAAGIPGGVIALLLFLTVREPARGGREVVPTAHVSPTLWVGLKLIASRPGLAHCMAGVILLAVPVSGIAAWIASFLVRSHGLSMTQVGFAVALAMGLLGSIGGLVSGSSVDWLNRRAGGFDPARPAFVSTFTSVTAAVLFAIALLAGSAGLAVGAFALCGLMLNAHNGPANSLAATLAGPSVRGLTLALIQFGANLIGWGVGPLIVGIVSSHFDVQNGVRWGLMSLLVFSIWGAAHFWLAGKKARLATAGS